MVCGVWGPGCGIRIITSLPHSPDPLSQNWDGRRHIMKYLKIFYRESWDPAGEDWRMARHKLGPRVSSSLSILCFKILNFFSFSLFRRTSLSLSGRQLRASVSANQRRALTNQKPALEPCGRHEPSVILARVSRAPGE